MLSTLTFKNGDRSIELHLSPMNDMRAKRIIDNFPTPLYPSTNDIWQHLVRFNEWDSIVDIGANYGEMSCIAFLFRTSEDIPIFLFEPSKALMSNLKLTFGKAKNIHLHEKAISNQDKTVYFRNFSNNSGKSNITHEYPDLSKPKVAIEQVEAITLDRVNDLGKRILIKIDVEGHETEVLQGARSLIECSSEMAILIEANQVNVNQIVSNFPDLKPFAYFRLSGKLKPLSKKKLKVLNTSTNYNMYHHDIVLMKKVESPMIYSSITSINQRIFKVYKSVSRILEKWKRTKSNGNFNDF
jgi:FkbM family methyltransferase